MGEKSNPEKEKKPLTIPFLDPTKLHESIYEEMFSDEGIAAYQNWLKEQKGIETTINKSTKPKKVNSLTVNGQTYNITVPAKFNNVKEWIDSTKDSKQIAEETKYV